MRIRSRASTRGDASAQPGIPIIVAAVLDILAIGDALVDVIATCEPEFLHARGLAKGAMRLVTAAEADRLHEAMGAAIERPVGRAYSADLAEARSILKADPHADLQPHHATAMLDDAMGSVRVANMAQTGLGAKAAQEPVNQIGLAAPSQKRRNSIVV